jgi:hypothetical protein
VECLPNEMFNRGEAYFIGAAFGGPLWGIPPGRFAFLLDAIPFVCRHHAKMFLFILFFISVSYTHVD